MVLYRDLRYWSRKDTETVPLVGMKTRDFIMQQVQGMMQYVEVEAVGPEGKPVKHLDVGLMCGLLTIEILTDIRDILLQLALSEIWWGGRAAMGQQNPLLVSKEMPPTNFKPPGG